MARSLPLARRNLLAEPRRLTAGTLDTVRAERRTGRRRGRLQAEGHERWFCSDSCRADFAADPDRYRAKEPAL